jgi:glycine/D-amino acid oxidase-like deaminating enzyme
MLGKVREGLFVATGHGSEGVILGAASAEQLAALVLGTDPPFDPSPFDPLRFGQEDPRSTTMHSSR